MASEKGEIQVLHKLSDWVKELLTHEELSNIFLSKDGDERSAWHMAAEKDQTVVSKSVGVA
jgi:hypothetical protein